MRQSLLLVLLCILIAGPAAMAQKKAPPPAKKTEKPKKAGKKKAAPDRKKKPLVLDLERVSLRPDWCDRAPRMLGWSADGKTFYYSLTAPDEITPRPTLAWDVKTRKATKLTDKQIWSLPPILHRGMGSARRDRGDISRRRLSRDLKTMVFTRNGDVFLREIVTGKEERLTRTQDKESSAVYSGDGQRIFYLVNGNLHAMDMKTHRVEQLTYIRPGPKPKPKKPESQAKTAAQKILFDQQKSLFEWIKERRKKREASEKRAKEREKYDRDAVQTFYTPDGLRASVTAVSPDGRYVVLVLAKPSTASSGKPTVVPTYVTESGFVETQPARTKVGEPLTTARYGILDVKKNSMKFIDPEPLRKAEAGFMGFRWSPDGKNLAVLALAQDYRTRWILSVEPGTGQAEVVDALHDPAWIGGPAWNRFGWMKDSTTVWFISEATGYAHLYTADRTGRFRRQLTQGEWEVQNVRLSPARDRFFLITNERHPGERHLYVMDADGGPRRRLTAAFRGIDDAALAPDNKSMVVQYSTPTRPPSLTLVDIGNPKRSPRAVTQIVRGATDAYLAMKWIEPRIVHFADRHGNQVYARLFVPQKPHPRKPAVVHVHGAGYAQDAHKQWQGWPFSYLFTQYLLNQGYHVLDLDYRGSAGYGRNCRTEIYRYMGGTEIDSGQAAVDYLVKTCGVNRGRVGIFGGSYGGFYTLMALFTRPGLFRAGVALYPVTDWSHYNHWYTSRILNLPQEDRKAYERSSPIYLAKNLKDRLQIQHGVVDSNVHFQDTMRLVQRLIELKKTDWDLVSYPVEGHGWRTPTSRLDSFRRMEKVFQETLLADDVSCGYATRKPSKPSKPSKPGKPGDRRAEARPATSDRSSL